MLVKNVLMLVCCIFWQRLDAGHYECWSKHAFSQKIKKIEAKFRKKLCFEFAPKCWLRVFFPKKKHFHPSTRIWVQTWKAKFCNNLSQCSCFLSFLKPKTWKKHNFTSVGSKLVGSAQHPNTVQNIQHTSINTFLPALCSALEKVVLYYSFSW